MLSTEDSDNIANFYAFNVIITTSLCVNCYLLKIAVLVTAVDSDNMLSTEDSNNIC